MLAILPRLAAAFNRSTLLTDSSQPDGENPADYYTNATTNHYARIVHATAQDRRGYAFPYDDVAPTGGDRPVRCRVQRQPEPADRHPRVGALTGFLKALRPIAPYTALRSL